MGLEPTLILLCRQTHSQFCYRLMFLDLPFHKIAPAIAAERRLGVEVPQEGAAGSAQYSEHPRRYRTFGSLTISRT